jgi:hypothetical protein
VVNSSDSKGSVFCLLTGFRNTAVMHSNTQSPVWDLKGYLPNTSYKTATYCSTWPVKISSCGVQWY